MLRKLRRSAAVAAVSAALAISLVPATPAAADDYDCTIMGGGNYVAEVVDCVYLVLSMIKDPFPPR